MSGVDVADAFYAISFPSDLRGMFSLMSVKAGAVGAEATVEGPVQPSEDIVPCFAAVPMGWNQELWLCQGLHEAIVARVPSLTEGNRFVDGKPGMFLGRDALAHTEYVDNFVALSMDRNQALSAAETVSDEMQKAALPVHETEISVGGQTLGWEFAPDEHEVGAAPRAMWRLRLVLTQVLLNDCIRGDELEVLLGHYTVRSLIRRELLSVMGASYRFAREIAGAPRASLASGAARAPVGQGPVYVGLPRPLGAVAP